MSDRSARVLVVDDSADDALVVSTLLRRDGYVVETVEDGEQALIAIDQFAPDVVLLDLHMPELDGFGVLDRLRTRASEVMPLVIVVSGDADASSVVKALGKGASDYVAKPWSQPILLARIAAVVRSRRLLEELRVAQRSAAIGAIAAGLAHEINNPAAFVVADLHEIREVALELEGAQGQTLAALCDESLEGMHRIRDVVHDLSVFASLIDARHEPSAAAVDVAKVVRRRVERITTPVSLSVAEGSLRGAPRAGGEAEVDALIGLLLRHALEGSNDATRLDVSLGSTDEGVVMTVERRGASDVRATEPPNRLVVTIVGELAERLGCSLDLESSRRGDLRYALTLPKA